MGLYRSRHYVLYHRGAFIARALAGKSNAFSSLALAGLSLGFALATKPNGLVVALVVTMLFVLVFAKPPRENLFASIVKSLYLGFLRLRRFFPGSERTGGKPAILFIHSFQGGFLRKMA